MRIITGDARGRKLKEPAGIDIRPTTDMVKESIFNIIQFDIEGRRVLDLFAGTGQLGIEALSRGAESCVFVDENPQAVKIVRENLAHCKLEGQVFQKDSLKFLESCGSFDLVFIDPPYDSGIYDKIFQKIFEFDILTYGGIMVCEHKCEDKAPEMLPPYYRDREYRYGKIMLTTYGKKEIAL